MPNRRLALLLLTSLLAAATAAAGEGPDPQKPAGAELERPPEWRVRLDRPDPEAVVGGDKEGDIWFVTMTPGWHITTGPAAIFYHPASAAEGSFRASARIHLFDPKGRKEGYGIFFGGRDLEGEGRSYLYFLLRNSGEFLIKARAGEQTRVLHPWTEHEAIVRYRDPEVSSVANDLAVEAHPGGVRFLANGRLVAALPREELGETSGLVGLRINHELNLHVSELTVSDLAPAAD